MVNLTIDDTKVTVEEGTTILEAAQSLGIEIPTLCYHAELSPIGACRVCLVDVEGEDRPVASCDTHVKEGMVVSTTGEELARLRKRMISLMLLNHPLDCPVCDKSSECDLQDVAVALGVTEQAHAPSNVSRPEEDLTPLIKLWHTRCIVCGRCVQICNEIQGARAIDYVVRSGFDSKVGPTELDGFDCESCGQCLTMCPAGVILDGPFMYKARPWELTESSSICTFCGDGCSRQLGARNGKVYRATVRDFSGLNKGRLCSVGRFGVDVVHSEARLTSPSVRTNGARKNVGWDEALDHAAQRLKDVVGSEGPESVAGLASARCSNEALFAFQRLMREGLGASRIDTSARLCNFAVIDTMTDVYGVPAPTATLSDIDEADAILVVDSNIITTHPVTALDIIKANNTSAAEVLVVGHRANKLSAQCAHFARTAPGSEVALLNCVANLLVEKGAIDDAAVGQSTEGYDKLKAHLGKYPLSDNRTGVDQSIISDMGDAISASKNFLVVLSPGSLHSAVNSSVARAAVNLALLKGGKVLSLVREGNAQGALDMGVSPNFLPGYKEATDAQSGSMGVSDILQGIESGEIKALYLMGSDIRKEMSLLGLSTDVLQGLDFLIAQDVFANPVTEMSHVALPACSFAECEGAYTSAFRAIQHSEKAIEPVGESKPDVDILCDLAQKLDLPTLNPKSVDKEIASSVPIYESIGDAAGAIWDYSSIEANGRKKLSVVTETSTGADEAHPYILTFDSMLHFGGSTSSHSANLEEVRIDAVIEICGNDAESLGVEDGAMVDVKVKDGGSAKLPVRISCELPSGVISVPAHSYEVIQSLITKLDPVVFKAEEGVPVWLAGISASRD